MGIKSLHKWLAWICSPPKPVCWDNWKNKAVGIDALGFLYRAKHELKNPIEEIAELILLLKSHQIQPIFVFDGKSPSEKQSTCLARKRQKERLCETAREIHSIQNSERNKVKQLLYATGCISINAVEEADSVLAFMVRQGWIHAILSVDMDFLPRGCENLIVPYKSKWQYYSLSDILRESKLNYSQFVNQCILMGTDYNPHIPTLSYQRIYWLLIHEKETMEEILKKEGIRDSTLWQRAYRNILGINDSWNTLVSEQQRTKWNNGPPPIEFEFCKTLLSSWSESKLNLVCTPISNYTDEVKSADVIAADLRVDEPLTTIQNVPIVNINNIRNKIADNNIYGNTR